MDGRARPMFASDRSFSPASYADLLNLRETWRKNHHRRRHDGNNAPIADARRNPDAGRGGQLAQPPASQRLDPATTQAPRPAQVPFDRRRGKKRRQREKDRIRDHRTAEGSPSTSDTIWVDDSHDDAVGSHQGAVDDTDDLPGAFDETDDLLGPVADVPTPGLRRRSEHSPAGGLAMLNGGTITVGHDAHGSTTPGSAAGGAAQENPGEPIQRAAMGRGTRARRNSGTECHLCGRGLGQVRHACMDCSALICPSCVINAATFHPGHTLQLAAVHGGHEEPLPSPVAQQNGTQRQRRYNCFICQQELRDERYKCQTCLDDLSLCSNCLDMHPENHVFEVISCTPSGSTGPLREGRLDQPELFRCFICRQQLSDVRYECRTCSDNLNFCEAHREMHPEDHPLAAIKCVGGDGAQPGHTIEEATRATSHADVRERVDTPLSEDERAGTEGAARDPRPAEPRRQSARLGGQSVVASRSRHDKHPNRDGSDDDEGIAPVQQLVNKHRQSRLPSQVTVTFSRQRLLQFARTAYAKADLALSLARAADEAGPSGREITYDAPGRDQHGDDGVDGEHGDPDGDDDDDYDLYKLLDFDLEFPLIETPEQRRPGRRRHRDTDECPSTNQRWTPDEKQQLRALKRQRKSDEHIATVLGRTPGAVAQQWRKQCL